MSTPDTCSAPSASTAIAATSAESIPPDSPISDVGEAVLAHVVARAEHERLVDLVHRREHRFDARRDARVERAPFGDLDLRQRQRLDPAARVELALAERGPHVDVDDEQVGDELLAARDQRALLVEDERRAVEHELVLAADEVRVDDRHRRVGRHGSRASSRARRAAARSTATR